MVFKVAPTNNDQWYFKIVARNGRILAHSESYRNKADAVSAAQTIINEAGNGHIEQ